MSRRLTLHVKPQLEAAIDRVTAANSDPRDNGDRRRAVERLVLDRARELDEQGDLPTSRRPGQDNALETLARVRKSRDRYRNLAVRAEAALLGGPVRDDYGGLEHRLEGALRHHGFEMPPASDSRRPVDRRRGGSRLRGGR